MSVTAVLAVYSAVTSSLALALGLVLARYLRRQAVAAPAPTRPAVLPPSGPPVGDPAPGFLVSTTSGRTLAGIDLAGADYLVAFFSASCQGCRLSLPRFVRYANAFSGAPDRVVAVVVGDARQGADIAAELAEVASVVVEPSGGGGLADAYRITLFPSYVLVDGAGVVTATGQSVEELPRHRQPR